MPRLLLPLTAVVALLGCAPVTEPCLDDADCASGTCLHDLDRGDRYCTEACAAQPDCPETRLCQTQITGSPGREDVLLLCVERVRSCEGEEICNGLDDDCDQQTDEDCATASCVHDGNCGGLWPCSPTQDLRGLQCTAPRAQAQPAGARCSEPDACFNGLCETGICAPLCVLDSHCPNGQRCARPSESGGGPVHSSCHLACDALTPCPGGLECTLRPDPASCSWRAVCAPALGAAGLGGRCEQHADCGSALCLLGHCSRPCASFADCTPVGLQCEIVELSPDPLYCFTSSVAVCL